jgi:hypothetical protein
MSPNQKAGKSASTPQEYIFDPWEQLANAVQLVAKQDQVTWTIFGVFWPANALLLVALFTTGALPAPVIGIVVSVVGLILSIVWTLIQYRAIAHLEFYEALIHRIEEKYLQIPPDVSLSGRINTSLFSNKTKGTIRLRPIMRATGPVTAFLWFLSLIWFIISSITA